MSLLAQVSTQNILATTGTMSTLNAETIFGHPTSSNLNLVANSNLYFNAGSNDGNSYIFGSNLNAASYNTTAFLTVYVSSAIFNTDLVQVAGLLSSVAITTGIINRGVIFI
jgi:hypothetical protein